MTATATITETATHTYREIEKRIDAIDTMTRKDFIKLVVDQHTFEGLKNTIRKISIDQLLAIASVDDSLFGLLNKIKAIVKVDDMYQTENR